MEARNDYKWVVCNECKHKLMRVTRSMSGALEIKCHSCKTINTIRFGGYADERRKAQCETA